MGLTSRKRNFTSDALADIRAQLDGPVDNYTVFSNFIKTNGDCFENSDLYIHAKAIDDFMTQSRALISCVTPRCLTEIETNIRHRDTLFASQCTETNTELQSYGYALDELIAAISTENFPLSFDSNKTILALNEKVSLNYGERIIFRRNMREQFGFDEKTVNIMVKVMDGIKEQNPHASQQMLDYYFTRAMSAFFYLKGDELKDQWSQGAGELCGLSEQDLYKYFAELGLSYQEYRYLRWNIRFQQQVAGSPELNTWDAVANSKDYASIKKQFETDLGYGTLTDGEFERLWKEKFNSYNGKGDFCHEMYTIAANLVPYCLVPDKWPRFFSLWTSQEERMDIAGWLGDVALKNRTMGNDDYIADLDARNISQMMQKQKLSYFEASNQYYNGLKSGDINRATTFLESYGTDAKDGYDNVRKTVLEKNGFPNTDEGMEDLKKKWPDSYTFLENLWNENNELQ